MRRKKARPRKNRQKTTARAFLGRNTMVAGGISKKHGLYGLVHFRAGRVGIKFSAGTRGVEVGASIGVGRRHRVGIDYNITTKSPSIRLKPGLKSFFR